MFFWPHNVFLRLCDLYDLTKRQVTGDGLVLPNIVASQEVRNCSFRSVSQREICELTTPFLSDWSTDIQVVAQEGEATRCLRRKVCRVKAF